MVLGFYQGFLTMYFFLIRPQVKRQKEHKAMVGGLKKGDEIQTMGGMMGKITELGDNCFDGGFAYRPLHRGYYTKFQYIVN